MVIVIGIMIITYIYIDIRTTAPSVCTRTKWCFTPKFHCFYHVLVFFNLEGIYIYKNIYQYYIYI